MRKTRIVVTLSLAALAAAALASTQITLFVVQPIGAIPEGQTLVITRLTNTHFIDSADAICDRLQGGVSLLCRAAVLGRVMDEARIYARLPYSEALYSISTGGKSFER